MPFEGIDLKLVAAIIGILGNVAFIPYIVDTLKRRTEPHAYTWLIWFITQGTATVGVIHGKGGLGVLGLAFGTILVGVVFLLSLKYGTKNIRKSDAVVLATAFVAIFVWWHLHQPVLAVVMVSIIDALGYIPTYRKSFQEPWSETTSSWGIFAIGNAFSLMALDNFNALTVTYIASMMFSNSLLVALLLIRRRKVSKPALMS